MLQYHILKEKGTKMRNIIINNVKAIFTGIAKNKGIEHLANGTYGVKVYDNKVCNFYKQNDAEIFSSHIGQVKSNIKNIKKSLKFNYGITNVKIININDFEEDGAVFVLSGVLKDTEVLIELWAKDYCVDIYPKDSSKWNETIFFGTLPIENS